MEDYFERVVETLIGAGYRWYETANFCRRRTTRPRPARASQPRLLARARLPRASASAPSRRSRGSRWRNAPEPARATSPRCGAASGRRASSSRSTRHARARERLLLGLRLDEPLALAGLDDALDRCARRLDAARTGGALAVDRRGVAELRRSLASDCRGDGVTADSAPERAARGSTGRRRPLGSAGACVGAENAPCDDGLASSGRPGDGYHCPANAADQRAQAGASCAGVVEEYVATGEPVGSKTLVERSGLHVSSSTVRSELAELESLGLLTHPHTSAGRIPTEAGYRFYATRAARAAGAAPGPLPARPRPRCAARSRRRSSRRRRCSAR